MSVSSPYEHFILFVLLPTIVNFLFIFNCISVSLYKLSTVGKTLFGLKKWSLITQFSSPITYYSVFIAHRSSLITYHLKHPTPFGTITHLSSLNIFQLFMGPIHVPCVAFTLFIYLFSFNSQYPNSPN